MKVTQEQEHRLQLHDYLMKPLTELVEDSEFELETMQTVVWLGKMDPAIFTKLRKLNQLSYGEREDLTDEQKQLAAEFVIRSW